jgi:hypothetical protein
MTDTEAKLRELEPGEFAFSVAQAEMSDPAAWDEHSDSAKRVWREVEAACVAKGRAAIVGPLEALAQVKESSALAQRDEARRQRDAAEAKLAALRAADRAGQIEALEYVLGGMSSDAQVVRERALARLGELRKLETGED